MDGFHYDDELLINKGLLAVKGSPQTFDCAAFEQLIQNLKNQHSSVYAPTFDRNLEKVIESSLLIQTSTQIIIVEGNYLLLNQQPWDKLQPYFDLSVFIQVEKNALKQRLIKRWLDHGFDLQSAKNKAINNDLVNAQLINQHSFKADMYFKQPTY